MPDSVIIIVAATGLALLVVALVLAAIALSRLGTLIAARDAAMRDAADQRTRLEVLAAKSEDFERDLNRDFAHARAEQALAAQVARTELGATLGQHTQTVQQQFAAIGSAQTEQLKQFSDRLTQLTQSIEQRLEAVRITVEQRLDVLRNENAKKLDEMRAIVDEKLQATLEQRLGQSFKQVSDRLEQVHKGLGEMQTLAAGVGDLKKVLTNVKSRGGWGEVQLGALLAEMLTPAQYAQNVATRPGRSERVEYAVKFPGRGEDGAPCWLPIDAKFPLEDYQRLQEAIERADIAAVEANRKALDAFFRNEAKSIRDKYVEPPHTTDFAVLFVPTEGLYAEAVSRPGLADTLQREFRVMLAGPMNLAAMLNSLQLGFRTLAIEQRSTEVWRVLGAVKTEFGKFGEILARTKAKLDQVGKTLDDAGRKSTTIARKLRDVEALPEAEADRMLTGVVGGVVELEVLPEALDSPAPEAPGSPPPAPG
jgi:DNA recombination protein RmuC